MSKKRLIKSTGITEKQADDFIESYLEEIKAHYNRVWQTPVKGTQSEEYAVKALIKSGIGCTWDGYDHAPGTDLLIGVSPVSMKSSTRKNKNEPTKSDVSGSRLTSYEALKKMLEALGNRNYNDMFMINRRIRTDVEWDKRILRGEDYREVKLIWLPGNFVKPNDYNWIETENNNGKTVYRATDFEMGSKLEIVPTMSSQYWIVGIDFEKYLKNHVIGSVQINRSDSEAGMMEYEGDMHLDEISNPDSINVQKEAERFGWNLK